MISSPGSSHDQIPGTWVVASSRKYAVVRTLEKGWVCQANDVTEDTVTLERASRVLR